LDDGRQHLWDPGGEKSAGRKGQVSANVVKRGLEQNQKKKKNSWGVSNGTKMRGASRGGSTEGGKNHHPKGKVRLLKKKIEERKIANATVPGKTEGTKKGKKLPTFGNPGDLNPMRWVEPSESLKALKKSCQLAKILKLAVLKKNQRTHKEKTGESGEKKA